VQPTKFLTKCSGNLTTTMTSPDGFAAVVLARIIHDPDRYQEDGWEGLCRDLLGLNPDEAAWLFAKDRQVTELVNALYEIVDSKDMSYLENREMSQYERHLLWQGLRARFGGNCPTCSD